MINDSMKSNKFLGMIQPKTNSFIIKELHNLHFGILKF